MSSVIINDNEIHLKNKVFINENLTDYNTKVEIYCRKLKGITIYKCYSRDGVVHTVTNDGWRDKATKVFHKNQILDLFPDIMFSGNNNATSDAVINAP